MENWATTVAPEHADGEDELEQFSSRSDTTAGDRVIDLKGDQFEDMTDSKLKLGTFDLWALGISTALGGQFYLWNAGIVTGFGGLIVGFFLIASAYGCLLMCMAELSGALPFAGTLPNSTVIRVAN
jgi:amino acid permease